MNEIFDDNDSDIVHAPTRKVLTTEELDEKQAEGKLKEGVIYIAYSNKLKWLVQECLYLVRKKAKTDVIELFEI